MEQFISLTMRKRGVLWANDSGFDDNLSDALLMQVKNSKSP